MPRPPLDYLNARRALKPASGGTNYRRRERAIYAPEVEFGPSKRVTVGANTRLNTKVNYAGTWIRHVLKQIFCDVRFRVRRQNRAKGIRYKIAWTDGPSEVTVQSLARLSLCKLKVTFVSIHCARSVRHDTALVLLVRDVRGLERVWFGL